MPNKLNFPSESRCIKTGCGDMFVHLIYTDETCATLLRVRVDLGKSGGCARSHLEVETSLINGLLKHAKRSVVLAVILEAGGHKCQYGDSTCHCELLSVIKEVIMKEHV